MIKLDIIYDENLIKCSAYNRGGASAFKTLLKINGAFCEFIFLHHQDQFKVVDPRTDKDSQFILSE